jgi:hypothetical protein
LADIFISYASDDRARVKPLADALGKKGWSVWWDRTIPAGRTFDEVIDEELSAARSVIVVWTSSSVKRNWVLEEAEDGLERGILVPVLMDKVRPPRGFRRIQAGDLIRWDGQESSSDFRKLVADLKGILRSRPAQEAEPLKTPTAPESSSPRESTSLDIFDADKSAQVPLKERLEAADALGLAGDPRLRLPRDSDYWARMDGFEIGRFPVTVHEYKLFVADGGRQPDDWDAQLGRPNCPVTRVSWHDAKAYCDWAGVRVPSSAEWERAAQGEEGREYPWGNEEPDVSRANYNATKLGRVSPVGLFPRGSTPHGIADMAGNVWEWVADRYSEDSDGRVLRGGSWDVGPQYLRSSFRDWDRPDVRSNYFGFRCAREVSP